MADYKVEVDLSELFDDMTINEQKNFLVDKFCSLPIDKMVEVVDWLDCVLHQQGSFGHWRFR